jgi:hypothetical protein
MHTQTHVCMHEYVADFSTYIGESDLSPATKLATYA